MIQSDYSDVKQERQTARTYQDRLRLIGHHLDRGRYRDVGVFEISGGFIARVFETDSRVAEVLEFPDGEFPMLLDDAVEQRGAGEDGSGRSALLPTGYEDFMRALGYLLDEQIASAVMICELQTHMLVAGLEPSKALSGHVAHQLFERYLKPDEIQQVLDQAFMRRMPDSQEQKRGLFRLF